MNIPFLKKYQPIFYKDFTIDNEYIELLTTLSTMNNLNILLVGNPGSGKTSLLYATIREYYQQKIIPKNNVLYINNLKEQGIQYYRTEVKTFCQTPSMIFGKKKFIILDDIDLINDQSQQVFRNCIDKYSHNVHFLASCSNTQKVIDSIQSRCTIIKIKPVHKAFLKKIYNKIKKAEKLDIEKNAEQFILNICNNSIRLLINYMEKFKLLNIHITEKKVKEICTNISFYEFEKYTEEWYINKDLKFAIQIINSIYKKGYSVMDILDSYFTFIKITDMIEENIKYKIIRLILKYIALFHTLHENDIELALFTNELLKLC
jgi:replication factor C subunit 2/4